tara:strand:+ start:74 stop:385 length:312 start_codon:yes stop_codon:yes gene_type:complete
MSLNNIDSKNEAKYKPIGMIFTNVWKKTGIKLKIVNNFTFIFLGLLFFLFPAAGGAAAGCGAGPGLALAAAAGGGALAFVGCLGGLVAPPFKIFIFILNKYFY